MILCVVYLIDCGPAEVRPAGCALRPDELVLRTCLEQLTNTHPWVTMLCEGVDGAGLLKSVHEVVSRKTSARDRIVHIFLSSQRSAAALMEEIEEARENGSWLCVHWDPAYTDPGSLRALATLEQIMVAFTALQLGGHEMFRAALVVESARASSYYPSWQVL